MHPPYIVTIERPKGINTETNARRKRGSAPVEARQSEAPMIIYLDSPHLTASGPKDKRGWARWFGWVRFRQRRRAASQKP